MRDERKYWEECLACAAEENDPPFTLTAVQIGVLAEAVAMGHENYGMAFYSPPPSDRLNEIERGWKTKFDALQAEFDRYRGNAETAVKRALRQYSDANVSIGEHGEVFRHGGRTEQIQ